MGINDNDENELQEAVVIKDAGNTIQMLRMERKYVSTVSILERSMDILIEGGDGVGIVTKPGLGVENWKTRN